jgi:HAD superfamily hydrolase (TIGR01509 family)
MSSRGGVLLDIDGTLVDTNYLHAVTWAEAFRTCGYQVATSRLHHLIGQGSDRLVAEVLGKDDQSVADAHDDFYAPHLHHLRAFDGAQELIRSIKARGVSVVLATSASERDARHLLAAIDADDAIDHVTTSSDADASKPAPDIVEAALDVAGLDASECVFVGDTVWDVEAASRAGMPCVCVLTGGIDERELREAGAIEIYENVAELARSLEESALGKLFTD